MKKVSSYITILFTFLLLNISSGIKANINDIESLETDFSELCLEESLNDELIREGRRQLAELIAYNEQNIKEGCPENNVYFFSLIKEDDWIEQINIGGASPDSSILTIESIIELNAELQALHAATDKSIFVCLVTDLPMEVVTFIHNPVSVNNLVRAYNQIGHEAGDTSAKNVEAVKKWYDGILQAVWGGTYAHLDPNIIDYATFRSSADRMLLAAGRIKATLMNPDTDSVGYKKYIMRSYAHKGYFKTYKDQLDSYITGFKNNGNNFERDIKASVDFVVNEQHDSTKAKMQILLDGHQNISDYAASQSNNDYDEAEINNGTTFLYDFAGIYNGSALQTVKDSLINVLNGSLIGTTSKMKMFITDSGVNQANKDIIKNLDLTQTVHNNTMILWVDVNADGTVGYTIRYSPDLHNTINAHIRKATYERLLTDAIYARTFGGVEQIIKFQAEVTFTNFTFISELLENHAKISPKWFRVDSTEIYNPLFKEVFKLTNPTMFLTNLSEPLVEKIDITIDGGIGMDDVNFALYCGLWNGLVDELKGVSDLIKMASGALVDEKTQEQVNQLYGLIMSDTLFSTMSSHLKGLHNGPTCKVAHQIGKDVMIVCTTFVPIVGAVSKGARLGKLSSFVNVCTKLAQTIDKLNPLTYAFSSLGWVIKKGAGDVVIIGKQIGNDIDKVIEIHNNTVLTLQNRYYAATLNSLEETLGPLDQLKIIARIIFTEPGDPPSLSFARAGPPGGQTGSITMGTEEFIVFAKKNGDPLDPSFGPQRLAKGSLLDPFVKILKNRFLDDPDTDLNIATLFNDQADDISTKLSKLSNAEKLLDDPGIRTALKDLPEPQRKQFYEDLAAGHDPSKVTGDHMGLNLERLTEGKVEAYSVYFLAGRDVPLRVSITNLTAISNILDNPRLQNLGLDKPKLVEISQTTKAYRNSYDIQGKRMDDELFFNLDKLGAFLIQNPTTELIDFSKLISHLTTATNKQKGANWVVKNIVDDSEDFVGKSLIFEKQVNKANGYGYIDVHVETTVGFIHHEFKSGLGSITQSIIKNEYIARDLFDASHIFKVKWRVEGYPKAKLKKDLNRWLRELSYNNEIPQAVYNKFDEYSIHYANLTETTPIPIGEAQSFRLGLLDNPTGMYDTFFEELFKVF